MDNMKRLIVLIGMNILIWCACRPKERGGDVAEVPLVAAEASTAESLADPSTTPLGVNKGAAADAPQPYPRGRWRLARADELQQVVLWISHILVRHEQVPLGSVSFENPTWTSAPRPPNRTRAAAWDMAEKIANHVHSTPASFEEIARESSEDVATRHSGGSLGGIAAIRLTPWPQILDAIGSLSIGETSRVVETEFGFHVLLRRAPPREEVVSGARIVISHDAAPWLNMFLALERAPKRSRADALALATDIYYRVRNKPEDFGQAALQYSEHRDAIRQGDFGAWSTREKSPFRKEIEVLAGLEVGAIAPPMDSVFGYQIIQRTRNRARVPYAMARIALPFDPSLPDGDPGSRDAVRRSAVRMLQALQVNPSQFDALQKQICCVGVQAWMDGRENAVLERALAQLLPGQIGQEPVEEARSFMLFKRLAPETVPSQTVTFELPAPERPDVAYIVAQSGWIEQLEAASREVAQALGLDGQVAERFAVLHSREGSFGKATSAEERAALYQQLQEQVSAMLGTYEYARYVNLLERHFQEQLVGHGAHL